MRGSKQGEVVLDCEAGRRLGCHSFCCRLIVRLQPGERDPTDPDNTLKHCVDKDLSDGLCVHFDKTGSTCTIWKGRPQTCREYDCNMDPLLSVVLERGFTSLVDLVRAQSQPERGVVISRAGGLQRARSTLPPPQQDNRRIAGGTAPDDDA